MCLDALMLIPVEVHGASNIKEEMNNNNSSISSSSINKMKLVVKMKEKGMYCTFTGPVSIQVIETMKVSFMENV